MATNPRARSPKPQRESQQHTPTPYFMDGLAIDSEQFEIAMLSEDADDMDGNIIDRATLEANGEFICRAVNAYDELVVALKKACDWIAIGEQGEDESNSWIKAHPEVGAALAKAQPPQPSAASREGGKV